VGLSNKSPGHEKVRLQNKKSGADDYQCGIKNGDIRTIAKTIKTNHALALELWETGNLDAQQFATIDET
jgi:3-methyladenine DNA glycosylase AlkD